CMTQTRRRRTLSDDRTVTRTRLLLFLSRRGASAKNPGVCFLTGGSTALLLGWRETTIDVALKFDPEPARVFDPIPDLKKELSINVELACPADFLSETVGDAAANE